MADEAFALSPISARAAQPSEEDYDAISKAFMETSRGRWFLGEYAKRNRNADTSMVLEAVARLEENLAAQRQPPPAPDNGLKEAVNEAVTAAKGNPDTPNLPALLGAQTYIPVDAALKAGVSFGPRERAMMVKTSSDICEKRGVLGSGYIPKTYQTDCTANTKGLFAYYSVAETAFMLIVP